MSKVWGRDWKPRSTKAKVAHWLIVRIGRAVGLRHEQTFDMGRGR